MLFPFSLLLPGVPPIPLPKDIPLPLPLPEGLLVFLLVVSFLLHILFVNLMLGGSILTLWAEIKGAKNPKAREYDVLAKEIANTITVNKSLAVVIGVAPLLSINTLYTVFFYSANALTGTLWISIVPLVTTAFLLLYFHKYSWERYKDKKRFHIRINGVVVLLLLFVPLIFLTNINLMLFPEKWGSVKGFFSAMLLANVIPRYLHFLCASLAVTGLFLFWYMKRKRYPFEAKFKDFSRTRVLKKWYTLALGASCLQLGLGPLNLFTLPWHAVNWGLVIIILVGVAFALLAMFLMWKELKGPEEKLGKWFYPVAIALTITVLFMGTGRHVYRAVALAPHQEKIEQPRDMGDLKGPAGLIKNGR
ncbi:MAG: cytochrome C [Candidatus Aminicenantes bacterium]|nr:MAG: cytochrome C [Candidatus Aminicenantes bacterium]